MAGIPLRSDPFKILMFGGMTTKTFILDTRKDINNNSAKVTLCSSNMTQIARFASKVDMVTATFQWEHYAVDGAHKVLHFYNEK